MHIPTELHTEIKRAAEKAGVSIEEYVETVLSDALTQLQKSPSKPESRRHTVNLAP
jgi:hypothetical protein